MARKRLGVLASMLGVAALATGVYGCGSKSSSQQDPVSTALQTPGVRTIVVSKQSDDLKVVIPPCSEAQTVQPGAKTPPPGSNQLIVPKGALTQTVAVQPCAAPSGGGGESSGSSSSGASKPPPSSTILVTPGGQQSSSSGGQSQSSPQNQLVLPNNSGVSTLIVPPCTQSSSSGGSSGGGSSGSGGSNSTGAATNLAVPAKGKAKSVTAPPCSVPQQSSS